MKVLYAQFGYMLRDAQTGALITKVYLPDTADTSRYEQVPREDIDFEVYQKITALQEKEASLNKIGKLVASQVDDDVVALSIQEFYDEWATDILLTKGKYIRHNDTLFKVLTDHTSQADWTPDIAASLFAKVLADPTGENIFEWQQPDSTNPYMTGDKVTHNGVTYISTIDNNVWEPGVYGWELVEES